MRHLELRWSLGGQSGQCQCSAPVAEARLEHPSPKPASSSSTKQITTLACKVSGFGTASWQPMNGVYCIQTGHPGFLGKILSILKCDGLPQNHGDHGHKNGKLKSGPMGQVLVRALEAEQKFYATCRGSNSASPTTLECPDPDSRALKDSKPLTARLPGPRVSVKGKGCCAL